MIREELRTLPTDKKTLRKFGLVVGGVLLALGGWFLYRGRAIGPWLTAPGATLFVLGLILPGLLRQVYLAWMWLAIALGMIVSTILLTLFYFFMITPMGVIGRVFGKDFLNEKLAPNAPSYWLKRDSKDKEPKDKDPSEYEQQY